MNLKAFLDEKVAQYNQPHFIEHDPIQIPHLFTQKQDIEIAGLFAAVLAWGQRITIIKKCKELLSFMDYTPFDFIRNHQSTDLKPFLKFKHRTFNDVDALYFIYFLKNFYTQHDSLEKAFLPDNQAVNIKNALTHFHHLFFSVEDSPLRTRKHISTPERKSACKRLNMYLRWMVRKDNQGVDFGIWEKIAPQDLICPLDVHVERVARKLHLLTRVQTDWEAAVELTENLKKFDSQDPVKYDFALFGLGLENF
jgi:uncharacterized protein (TIGR02757 family)